MTVSGREGSTCGLSSLYHLQSLGKGKE
uniref:Uncharacterized protein n=1 Tax=Anguilla anguilla TaxID=7936 RepID=A0A0E9VNS9_ANGAN